MHFDIKFLDGKLLLKVVALGIALLFAKQVLSLESDSGSNGSAINWSSMETYQHVLSESPLSLTKAGTHVLSGKSTKSITVSTDGKVRLILAGVNIRNTNGPAISIENADKAVIELAAGSENYLEDASTRDDDGIDGVIYSSDDLIFQGSGKLTVKANFEDGIVSKDDLDFYGGVFDISSGDDGIRGKDSLVIHGGVISVVAKGDGIKSSNEGDSEKGNIHIKGGSITIDCDDDGIKAVNDIVVDGGQINVVNSLEGMEASNIILNDGDIRVVASDDGINAVNDNWRGDMSITVNGGNIDVTVGTGDTDAFDSNGSILIAGGNINVTAPTSSFDSDGGAKMTGGTLVVNGQKMTEIPAGRRGGGRWGGRGMGGSREGRGEGRGMRESSE